MSYTDQTKRSSPASIAAVVGVHLAIGYAIVSGLAYTVIRHIPIITAVSYPDDPPPPPPIATVERTKLPMPVTTPVPAPHPQDLKRQEVVIPLPPISDDDLGGAIGGGTGEFPAQPPVRPSLAHDAVPGADRLRWITTDDYPAGALRQGITGTVMIAAVIGTDGKVRACEVTRSSGSPILDETTCRLYARRAHFSPALDADGNPVAARRADRFRWQIPNE